ncbi:hypothetical protein L1987_06601 [Smallanthus sonchifolius]|uniref:Uncharacterized protein n=1 Tax=Smallanthus sonchifolius TaxID=185202 RepID=A0ACB9JYV1_9ASTR|nr:hypothetical protein L1987_06601 [Smallanthus sonchifolius]
MVLERSRPVPKHGRASLGKISQSNTSFINSITFYSQETVQIISQASNLHSRSNCYQLSKELDPPIISKVSEGLEQPESQQKPPEANLAVAGTPFYRSLSIPFCLR